MFGRNGVILITTLFFVTLIVMFSVLVAQQGRQTLLSGVGFSNSEQAYLAAMSGIEYVKGELTLSKKWGVVSGDSGEALDSGTISSGGVIVKSDGNAVVGYLDAVGGDVSKSNSTFSVSFSEPDASKTVHNALVKGRYCKYLSLNNLSSSVAVPASGSLRRNVPAHSFYVVSKGVCGKHVKYVEAVLTIDGYSGNCDGSTLINGNVKINSLSPLATADDYVIKIDHVRQNKRGKLMASGDISILSSGQGISSSNAAKAIITSSSGATLVGNSLKGGVKDGEASNDLTDPDSGVVGESALGLVTFERKENADYSSEMESLSDFAKVIEGYEAEMSNRIPQGNYVFCNGEWHLIKTEPSVIEIPDPSNSDAKISVRAFTEQQIADSTVIASKSSKKLGAVSLGDGIEFNDRTVKVNEKISSDDSAVAAGSSSGLNFAMLDSGLIDVTGTDGVTSKYYRFSDSDSVDFQVMDGGSVVSYGDLKIEGELIGNGKVFAKGSLAFNGGSALETAPNSGVVAWAGNGITISPAKNVSNQAFVDLAQQGSPDEYNNYVNFSEEAKKPTPDVALVYENNRKFKFSSAGSDKDFQLENTYYKNELKKKAGNTPDYLALIKIENGETRYSDLNSSEKETVQSRVKDFNDSVKSTFVYEKTFTEPPFDNYKVVFMHKDVNLKVKIGNDGNLKHWYNDVEECNTFKKYLENYLLKEKQLEVYVEDNTTHNAYAYDYDNSKLIFLTDDTGKTESDVLDELRNAVRSKLASDLGRTYIKGSLYAGNGNIKMDTSNHNFDIQGAIFTKNGDLILNNTSKVHILYDPDYVPISFERGVITSPVFMSCFDF